MRRLDRTLWCRSLLPRPWNVQIPNGEFCALQENPEKPASVNARETTRGVSAVMSAAAAQPAPGGRRNRLGFIRLIGPGLGLPSLAVRVIIPDIRLPCHQVLATHKKFVGPRNSLLPLRPAVFALAKAAGALYVAALSDSLR